MNIGAQEKQDSPIFILGRGRSGTTLLQRLLNTHPEVNIWGEHGGFLEHAARAYFQHLESEIIRENWFEAPKPMDPIQHLKNPELWPGWVNWYGRDDVKIIFRRFIDSLFNPSLLKPGTQWGFKEICYGAPQSRTLEMLAELYPKARFIVIIRDPVDVVASQLASWDTAKKVSLKDLARRWLEDNKKYLSFLKSHPERALLIRYEDLTGFPAEVLTRLTAFLGVNYTDKEFVLSLEEARGTTRGPAGVPRDDLCEEEIREIQTTAGELSEFFLQEN